MPVKKYYPSNFKPTVSLSGDNAPTCLYAKNGFLRGRGSDTIFEVYNGSLDLGENIPSVLLTGTITFTVNSLTVNGTSTLFQSELHLGQMLVTTAGAILSVAEIISDTIFKIHSLPHVAGTGVTAYRMPVIFSMGNNRGTLLSGNAYEADTGNILIVGSGEFRRNGQTLTASVTAAKRAKIAIWNGTTYTVYPLQFTGVPAGITATATAAPAATTFTNANVTISPANTIVITTHGYQTGQSVTLTTAGTFPAPLVANTVYYVIKVNDNTVKLASLLQNAVSNVPIAITTTGSGTINVTPVSKNMPARDHSIRIAKASTKLTADTFGNPSEPIAVTTTAGQRIALLFPAMDSNTDPASLHDAWRVYVTLTNATGVWYYVRTVTSAELGGTAGGTYYLEYLDGEASAFFQLISFDNDPPPDAEFIADLTGLPILISCQGKATATEKASSPGVSIVPLKVNNAAAAPLVTDSGRRAEVPTSPVETIIGFIVGAGRLYLLTANYLPLVAFTNDPDFPIAARPFWSAGFRNPYGLCFVIDKLYGWTTGGAFRSPEEGQPGSEDHSFAADVEEFVKDWDASRVIVAHDPSNECVCYCYGGAYRNANGFWGSIILPFNLRRDEWEYPIFVESATEDRIITGAATVNGRMEFLSGGRHGSVKTFRFDGGLNSGETVSWQYVPQLSDDGAENRPKTVKYPRITARGKNITVGIFGASAGEVIDIADIQAGNAESLTGAIALPDAAEVTIYDRTDAKLTALSVYTVGVEGVWNGTGKIHQLHEITIESIVRGGRA